jgi:hypothetical protein
MAAKSNIEIRKSKILFSAVNFKCNKFAQFAVTAYGLRMIIPLWRT